MSRFLWFTEYNMIQRDIQVVWVVHSHMHPLIIPSQQLVAYTLLKAYITDKWKQEGHHLLTGQCAANFRLLANQWAESRLVTQWRHGCRAMRRSVCNAGASDGGQSLCIQISRERSYPHANILIPLERQLIALQLCRWQLLYNETLQQTFCPLLSKLSKKRQI